MSWSVHDSEYLEARGVPTSTLITSAFLNHARRAAKNLHIDALPLLVPPHPLYDLAPDELRELARICYPLIVEQLTGRGALAPTTRVAFHPASRSSSRPDQPGEDGDIS